MSGETTNIEKAQETTGQTTKQSQIQNYEKKLTQTLQTKENNGLAPEIHKINARLQYNTTHAIKTIENIWWKLTFIVWREYEKDSTVYYSVIRWDQEIWQFSYIHQLKNIWDKPAFIARKKDWNYAVMRWHDELITIHENEDVTGHYFSSHILDGNEILKDIWRKPAFAVRKKDWNYIVMRWKEKLWEFEEYISSNSLINIWDKPAFVVDKKGWNRAVMRWKEKLWEFKRVINKYIAYIWKKPMFLAEKENWDEVVMRWDQELAAEHMPNSCCHPVRFDKIVEIQEKPIFCVNKNDKRQIIMRWSEELWEITHKENLWFSHYLYTVKWWKNICKIFWEDELKESSEFSFRKRGLSGETIYIIERNWENYVIHQPENIWHMC